MFRGDGAYIKKINKSLILEQIIKHQSISRADLSKITGLNKATVSVQVAELLEKELINESRADHNSVGRRPVLLSINKTAGHVLGVDFDDQIIKFVISDLAGNIVSRYVYVYEVMEYKTIVTLLAKQINQYVEDYSHLNYGLISCVIGVHGTVDKEQTIQFIPKLKWSDISLKEDLEELIEIPLTIENNVNLSALGEKAFHFQDTSHLLSINLSSGIGAGRMLDWEMDKGYQGFSGEMGHMIISPIGPKCSCGNNGCWELYSTERSLFKKLSNHLDKENFTFEDFEHLLSMNVTIAQEMMQEYIYYVAIGLNNVINIYNPGFVVLNSRVLSKFPNAIQQIKDNLVSNVSSYENIVLSKLEGDACVLGGCALGIRNFFEISELILDPEDTDH